MHDVATRPPRELAVDLYRVCAVALVVMGHWLAASVVYRDGHFVRDNVLAELPWTQWLTWIFQVVPIFFLVAGYAGAASWTSRDDASFGDWHGDRVRRVLGPTSAYVLVVLAAVCAARFAHVDASSVSLSGWAIAMHMWFIPVYLVLVAFTPLSVEAHRRWGLFVPLALAVAVGLVDAASISGWMPALGWANNLLCWLAIYQLGVAWFFGALNGGRPVRLAAAGGGVIAVAIGFGPYPVSMIGVPGQTVQNSAPPSIVMLALGLAQAGVLTAFAPAVTHWLRHSAVQHLLAAANSRAMMVYLWHMIAVVVLAVVAVPRGWFPQPALGTGAWWLSRLVWVALLWATTALILALVNIGRPVLAENLIRVPVHLPVMLALPSLLIGASLAAVALWHFASEGFAPLGRLPLGASLLYVVGIALAVLYPIGTERAVRTNAIG